MEWGVCAPVGLCQGRWLRASVTLDIIWAAVDLGRGDHLIIRHAAVELRGTVRYIRWLNGSSGRVVVCPEACRTLETLHERRADHHLHAD